MHEARSNIMRSNISAKEPLREKIRSISTSSEKYYLQYCAVYLTVTFEL